MDTVTLKASMDLDHGGGDVVVLRQILRKGAYCVVEVVHNLLGRRLAVNPYDVHSPLPAEDRSVGSARLHDPIGHEQNRASWLKRDLFTGGEVRFLQDAKGIAGACQGLLDCPGRIQEIARLMAGAGVNQRVPRRVQLCENERDE